jgi:hypothetical protein
MTRGEGEAKESACFLLLPLFCGAIGAEKNVNYV